MTHEWRKWHVRQARKCAVVASKGRLEYTANEYFPQRNEVDVVFDLKGNSFHGIDDTLLLAIREGTGGDVSVQTLSDGTQEITVTIVPTVYTGWSMARDLFVGSAAAVIGVLVMVDAVGAC